MREAGDDVDESEQAALDLIAKSRQIASLTVARGSSEESDSKAPSRTNPISNMVRKLSFGKKAKAMPPQHTLEGPNDGATPSIGNPVSNVVRRFSFGRKAKPTTAAVVSADATQASSERSKLSTDATGSVVRKLSFRRTAGPPGSRDAADEATRTPQEYMAAPAAEASKEAMAKAIEEHHAKARRAAAANGFRGTDGSITPLPSTAATRSTVT